MTGKTALVVDDQETFREAIGFEIQQLGFNVDLAEDGKKAYQKFASKAYSLILSDIRMPNWDGVKLLQEVRKVNEAVPFILMTGFADISLAQAFSIGADAFLGKPLDEDTLNKTINTLLMSPLDRISQTIIGKPQTKITGTGPEIELGRRGFFLEKLAGAALAKTGDLIEFDLTPNSMDGQPFRLQGTGRLLWIRSQSDEQSKAGLGVELLNISEGAQSFLQYVASQKLLATIPFTCKPQLAEAS